MAGTGNCQVVVTASGKLKGEGAQVWVITQEQVSFNMYSTLSFKAHSGGATWNRHSQPVKLQ